MPASRLPADRPEWDAVYGLLVTAAKFIEHEAKLCRRRPHQHDPSEGNLRGDSPGQMSSPGGVGKGRNTRMPHRRGQTGTGPVRVAVSRAHLWKREVIQGATSPPAVR